MGIPMILRLNLMVIVVMGRMIGEGACLYIYTQYVLHMVGWFMAAESCESFCLGPNSVRLRFETANPKYPSIEAWEIQPFHLFLQHLLDKYLFGRLIG